MPRRFSFQLNDYYKISVCFLISFCLIRVFEYFTIASKFFISHPYLYELYGFLYDVWTWLICLFVFYIFFFLFSFISKRFAKVALHIIHVAVIVAYIALIIVFTERNTPFDHELFTRSLRESWLTSKQMMTSGFKLYIPFILFIGFYFFLYYQWFKKVVLGKTLVIAITVLSILSVVFIKYSNSSRKNFNQVSEYYLTCNKLNFWLSDTYQYFSEWRRENRKLLPDELREAISFYQSNQPFNFIGKEYPLLHTDTMNDVLGGFFNLNAAPPNIVILVVEGLSKDFSGDNAYATSFTPFLDSLSKHSLVWDNFLSTAPGTFAAQPAITGSVPYASRGFSLQNVMPDHLSLIKALKANGYWTNFLIGFNPDFDNMGGYIRLQGTDFILSQYSSRYKQMGVGAEGWSMGYPDDALFNRSFEVMDSLNKTPYLNIYHTATTHMPYLFAQKKVYDKLFEQKLKTIRVPDKIKQTLRSTKEVLVTFMFSDDCIKKFFARYAHRKEYSNTIFFITGDHHIGSFPSTCTIDDYHVPLIIYSPMLKSAQKFLSVNSHNNLTPTILSLLLKNYSLPYKPDEVSWLGDVMDTCASFRNIHSMPFMEWSRDISDYIWKDYFLSGDDLYKLTPDLQQKDVNNDSVKRHMIQLRENFKIINRYVCENNKLFPAAKIPVSGKKDLLLEWNNDPVKNVFVKKSDVDLMSNFNIPSGYKYLYVEVSALVNSPASYVDTHLALRLALVNETPKKKDYLYWSLRNISAISNGDFIPQQWNSVSSKDMFTLDDYKKYPHLQFNLGVWTDSIPINFQMKNLNVKVYGIKPDN